MILLKDSVDSEAEPARPPSRTRLSTPPAQAAPSTRASKRHSGASSAPSEAASEPDQDNGESFERSVDVLWAFAKFGLRCINIATWSFSCGTHSSYSSPLPRLPVGDGFAASPAPSMDSSTSAEPEANACRVFALGERVFALMKGYPHWPALITEGCVCVFLRRVWRYCIT